MCPTVRMKLIVLRLREGKMWGQCQEENGENRESSREIFRWCLASSREIFVKFVRVLCSAARSSSISECAMPSMKVVMLELIGVALVQACSVRVNPASEEASVKLGDVA